MVLSVRSIVCLTLIALPADLAKLHAAQVAPATLQRDSLRAVGPLQVMVEKLDSDIERRSLLTASRIQVDAARRLAASGVPVISPEWGMSQAAVGFLYIKLSLAEVRDFFYAYALEVSFRQPVQLVRRPRTELIAPTWIRTRLGTTAALQSLRSTVDDLVDDFVRDYVMANPER